MHGLVVEFNPKIQSQGIGDYDQIFSHVTFWLTMTFNSAKISLTDVHAVTGGLKRSITDCSSNVDFKITQLSLIFSEK